jgi:prophage tail gpP-like protein
VGETAFESIDRMLRIRHVLATDNEKGELVFIEAGSERADTDLELGMNILSGDAGLDYKDRYSEYRCKGQRAGDDEEFAEEVAEEDAAIGDVNIGRKRVLVMKQHGQADEGTCRDRVEYERAHRAAKSLQTTYTVQGWRQGSGALWKPNLLVRVKDPVIGFDAEMLIAEVDYKLNAAGMIATLKVGPVDGYVSKAARKKKGKTGSSWNDLKPFL